jgi:predicted kinase
MNKLQELEKFLDYFKSTKMWAEMQKTKEDSPWHREESVAVHTEMVLDALKTHVKSQYVSEFSEDAYVLTFLSLLFHDVGKPPAKMVKFKEERGYYNAFHGHEQMSARMFEDFYVSNYGMFAGWLPVDKAYEVMWMIENHLPYDAMHSTSRMDYLRTACEYNLPTAGVNGFALHLLSDTYGRISDDAEQKRKKTEDFTTILQSANVHQQNGQFVTEKSPSIKLLVGASGSGKSSYVNQLVNLGYVHFSFDDLRIKLAKEKTPELMAKAKNEIDEYRTAFDYCDTHRSEFSHYADVEFIKLVKDYRNIVVDNTNVSRKSRTKFVVETKKRGYHVAATMFPVNKKTLLDRMETRTDKKVPDDAVLRQYMGISIPWVGVEVHSLDFMTSNLPKLK